MFGTLFFVSQYLQFVLGYDALRSGAVLLPVALALVIAAPAELAARRPHRHQARRHGRSPPGRVALWLFSAISVHSGYAPVGAVLVILGVGMGLAMAPATDSIMGSLPREKAGVGSAMNDTTREIGGALGVAIIGSLTARRTPPARRRGRGRIRTRTRRARERVPAPAERARRRLHRDDEAVGPTDAALNRLLGPLSTGRDHRRADRRPVHRLVLSSVRARHRSRQAFTVRSPQGRRPPPGAQLGCSTSSLQGSVRSSRSGRPRAAPSPPRSRRRSPSRRRPGRRRGSGRQHRLRRQQCVHRDVVGRHLERHRLGEVVHGGLVAAVREAGGCRPRARRGPRRVRTRRAS